ncbi:hypothetical protein ATCC90586_001043 [Pythium insidiosum]|nr:hypothetical protein ATCC90586_001043 [Pythium insidiosum]
MGRFLGGNASPRGGDNGGGSGSTSRRGRAQYEALSADDDQTPRHSPRGGPVPVRRRASADENERHDEEQDGGDRVQLCTSRSTDRMLDDSDGDDEAVQATSEAAAQREAVAAVFAERQRSGSAASQQQREEETAQTAATTEQPEQRAVDAKDEGADSAADRRREGVDASSNNDNNARGESGGDASSASSPGGDQEEEELEPGFIRIRILDLNGKFFNIACHLEWTVLALKRKVLESTEVAIASQRLIYRGRVLEDDKILNDYKVEDGHTVHLFVRMSQNNDAETAATDASSSSATAGAGLYRYEDGAPMTIVHISSDTISSAVFPSDSARRVDPLMLDSALGNCARRVKLWSSFLLIIYTMKVMGQFALLANDQQMRSEENKDDTNHDRYYDRYDYPPYYNQDPMISAVELMIHAFGVYVGCVGFKAAHDTDIRPIRFYCRGIVWLAILTVAEQIFVTVQISKSDYPETRIQYPYGPSAPSKEDLVSANIFQSIMLVVMWVIAIHHSYAHQAEVAAYNQSFAAAAMNAVPPPAHVPEVV